MTSSNESQPQSRREARESERLLREREQAVQAPVEPDLELPVQPDAEPFDTKYAPTPQPHTSGGSAHQYPLQTSPETPPAIPLSPEPEYRERDFSPEGSAPRATGRRAAAPAPEPFVGNEPAVAPVQPPLLSRRELRLRQAEEARAAELDAASAGYAAAETGYAAASTGYAAAETGYAATPPPLDAPDEPEHPTALSNAMAEFEALTRTNQPEPPQAEEPVAFDFATPTFIEPTIAVSDEILPPPQQEQEQDVSVGPRTGSYVPPTGHWSRQRDLDDETQPWENTITREVGGSNVATTTSALVLPEIPLSPHFSSALDSTGEVLLTGSIDLPRSLSTIGGDSRSYDGPQVDLMFESQDAEYTGTDSAPVSAIRAVSTQTSARGVIHSTKPHGNRMLVVGFIATAVLAVAVASVLVAALVFKVF